MIGSGGSTSGLSTGVGSRLYGTSVTGALLGGNTTTAGERSSTELLSNYKSQPGSVMAGGGGGLITDFDSISQLSQKAYMNTIEATKTTQGGEGVSNIAIGNLTNLETSDTSVIDYNLINEEMKYRKNLDNMYKKGM